ncbi:unnamed protein product [Cyclocybe aegerita]|uniref:Uncharacterized protein n=1 Tax=Cyclocybe aegerita TaxID=1973307 RepID=A0A8S0XUB8_CYCAE|nr:unnamed protein product [Cyclocybe aegerita]
MSTPPNDAQDDAVDKQSPVDELAEPNHTADDAEAGTSTAAPVKRGRGRPKGSKNKKAGTSSAADSPTTPTVPRKRGRPPKEKKEEPEGEPTPKRPRGRPPKNPKPAPPAEGAATTTEGGEAPKKKRGRPPKKTTT